ncbi:MAG TPA: ATP-binding protein [Chloroflexota bacterium]
MRRGLTLRGGILLTVLASVLVTDLLATWAITGRLDEGAQREAEAQARGRAAMSRALLDQRLATLASDAENIALYPAVISAVDGSNRQPLVTWAAAVAARQGIHVKVFDAQGTPLAHGHNADRLGPMVHDHDGTGQLEGLRRALGGEPASGIETSDEIGLALRGFAPVRRPDGDVVGAVMLADPLDTDLLTRLAGGASTGLDLRLADNDSLRDRSVAETCSPVPYGSAALCSLRLDGPTGEPLTTHLFMTVPLADVAQARDDAQRAAWITGAALLLLGAAAAWWMSGSLVAPLARLTAAARGLGRGSNADEPIGEVGWPHEVRVLASAFDSMHRRVASATAALGGERDVLNAVLQSAGSGILMVSPSGERMVSNQCWADLSGARGLKVNQTMRRVGDGVTFYEAATAWLAEPHRVGGADFEDHGRTYTRLRCYTAPVAQNDATLLGRLFVLRDVTRESEAERLRNAFLATISHELRTPLAAIAGYTGTLLTSGPWDEKTQREFLEIIDGSAALLSRLVENLLDAAALEVGALRLDTEPLRVERLAEQVVVRLRPLATSHTLHVNAVPDLPMAVADPLRVEQVLSNLVENAIKYSPEGGPIAVSLVATELGDVHVGVSDSGIGIPPEEIGQVFERFYRAENSNRSARGAGLGLFLCRRLVEAHGGRIWVTSQPGVGSTFHLILPGLAAHEATPARQRDDGPATRRGVGLARLEHVA